MERYREDGENLLSENEEWVEYVFRSREEIMSLIEDQCGLFVDSLVSGSLHSMSVPSRRRINTGCDQSSRVRLGLLMETKTLFCTRIKDGAKASHAQQIWVVLAVVYSLLKYGKKATLREIYYMKIRYFKTQTELNRTIETITRLFGCHRINLNVMAAARGLITGAVAWQAEGDSRETLATQQVLSIPGAVGDIRLRVLPGALCVLVCEKEAVFTCLAQGGLCARLPVILVTGQGYPPVAVRQLVARLEREGGLRVYGLVDYNPSGLKIYLTYKHGTTGVEGHCHSVGMQLLGITHSHIQAMQPPIPQQLYQQWTARDQSLHAALLKSPLMDDDHIRHELELQGELRQKLECEALNCHNPTHLLNVVHADLRKSERERSSLESGSHV